MPKSLKPVNKKRPLQQSKLTSKKPTQSPMPLTIFKNIGTLLTLQGARIKQGRKITESDLSIIPNAAIVIEGEVIKWAGPEKNLQKDFLSKNKIKKIKSIDIQGRTVLPGLIECHTHSLFAGSRSHEFEQRLRGVTYQEIAKQGGGILSTVKNTRALKATQVKNVLTENIAKFCSQGVTTIEIKTGYGLDKKSETEGLKVINSMDTPRVISTFLGAHAIAPEFQDEKSYLDFLTSLLPEIRKHTERLDIYIERGFFSFKNSEAFLNSAKKLGFDILVHANQLSPSNTESPAGVEAALKIGAVSCEHVIHLSDTQIKKLAHSEITCVLLPTADLYMRCDYPNARKLIDEGARVALATDFNPGTSPSPSVDLAGLLARLQMNMSLPEVICAYTVGAAFALKLENQCGCIETNMSADFLVTSEKWTDLFYEIGPKSCREVYYKGRRLV